MLHRRDFLRHAGGALALPAFGGDAFAQPPARKPEAKRAIFVVLNGGLSHVDSFDPKPALAKHAGQALPEAYRSTPGTPGTPGAGGPADRPGPGTILPSPWPARARGKSGIEITDLFAGLGELIDRFWILRAMTTPACVHAPALRLLLTGHPEPGHPAIGAWLAHRLGPEARSELPAFVAIGQGRVASGDELWGHAYLPETCAGAYLDVARPELWRTPTGPAGEQDRERLVAEMDRRLADATGLVDIKARAERRTRERSLRATATRLHDQRPRRGLAMDFGDTPFGMGCRLACDLVEKGVRVVQMFSGTDPAGRSPFDSHGGAGIERVEREAKTADRALSALVRDLDRRGLLDETLVVIATEFGRSPVGVNTPGRGFARAHNPHGFSVLLAGSGLAGGRTWGTTDELGLRAMDNALSPQDLLANVLTRFRIKPAELTYRHRGRVFSPVDAGSHIVRELRPA